MAAGRAMGGAWRLRRDRQGRQPDVRRPDRGVGQIRPDGSIADTGFEARGCAISVASADLMAETVKGRGKADTRALFETFREMARTGTCPHATPHSTNRWNGWSRWRACTNIRRG